MRDIMLWAQEVYGPEYFTPCVPRLTPHEFSKLEAIVKACNRGAGAALLPLTFARCVCVPVCLW